MRDTVGYRPRKQHWRPADTFAYAGGEIRPPKLPDPASPIRPAAAQIPPEKEAQPKMDILSPETPQNPTQTSNDQQSSIIDPSSEQIPKGPSTVAHDAELIEIPASAPPASVSPEPGRRSKRPKKTTQAIILQPPQNIVPLAPSIALQARGKVALQARGGEVNRAGNEEAIGLDHHVRRCTICHHPDRDAIDQAFLHWQRPSAIAHHFNLGERRIVYRHAHALGLFQKRASQSRRVLEFIMEQAETVTATADSVIRAVRAHSCMDENGRWTEPPKRVLFTQEVALPLQRGPRLPPRGRQRNATRRRKRTT